MTREPLALKRPSGFFAAGREVDRALTLLSDGAFKLFVYLCLHAERGSGRLRFRLADLARRLGKSPRSITSYLGELQRQDVCAVQAAVNQHHAGLIEIRDGFWPYHKPAADAAPDAQTGYVDRVRTVFLSRACIAGGFSAADERLAAEWRQCGVPLEQVERACLLGCARKYVALLNHPGSPLISSLRYFTALLAEVAESPVTTGYWQHLNRQVETLERRWRNRTAATPTGHANFAPADSAATAQKQGETR